MRKLTLEKLDQEELVIGVIKNDGAILKYIYQENFAKVRQLILKHNGDEEQAKDIYQEAFATLWMNIKNGKFKPENESAISGYLYKVAKNKWFDYLRSPGFKTSTSIESHQVNREIIEDEEKEGLIQQIEIAFKHLGDKCQALLKKFYYEKQSMEEIAYSFGWTPASARNNKYRCIQQLREKIKANGLR